MAQQPHNNATTSLENQRRPESNQTSRTGASLFTSRNQTREPFSWSAANAERRHRRAVQSELRAKTGGAVSSAGSSPVEEFVPGLPNSNSDRVVEQFERDRMLNGRFAEGDGYGRGGGKGVQNSGSVGAVESKPRISRQTRTNAGGGSDTSSPGSRIPVMKSTTTPGQSTHTKQRAGLTDASHDVHAGTSDSEVTESVLGSPSPAAKQRREAKYRAMGLAQYSDEELDRMKGWRQRTKEGAAAYQKSKAKNPSSVEDSNDPYAVRRTKLAESDARLARIAARSTPLFVKSTTYNRVIETARELERKTSGAQGDDMESRVSRPATSASRQRPAWVERILNPDTSIDESNPPTVDVDQSLHDAADSPLPSIEDPVNPTPRFSRPAQTHHMSPEKSKMWDGDLDFTGHSIQISNSPQLRVRRLDHMRDQEISDLAARAVATNRLDEIRVRNSEERTAPTEIPIQSLSKPEDIESRKQSRESLPIRETDFDDQGVTIPGTPFTVYESKAYRAKSPWREEVDEGETQEDAMDVLRALSRSISGSPPIQPNVEPNSREQREPRVESLESKIARKESEELKSEAPSSQTHDGNRNAKVQSKEQIDTAVTEISKAQDAMLGIQSDVKSHSRSSSRPRSEADPEERIAAEAKLFELQDNKSEKNSTRAPSSPGSEDENFDETPKPKKKDPLTLPTPRVMGAFIETPAPTVRKPRQSQEIRYSHDSEADIGASAFASINKDRSEDRTRESSASSSQQESRKSSRTTSRQRPPLINSAKPASALDDIKRLKVEAQIDDSTVDSIENFSGVPVGRVGGSKLKTEIIEPVVDLEYDEKGYPLSEKERERRLEQLALERMNQHLKNTTSSIRDARHGIERLEQQVSSSFTVPLAHQDADEKVYIKVPVPRLWTRTPVTGKDQSVQKSGSRSWKFTWLGLILFIFSTWYVAESVMCEIYCHPEYSSKNTWKPTDPFFPWAIPTKFDQWTGEVASTGVYYMWDSVDGLLGPKKGRRRWWWSPGPTPTMTASNWWMGRDGPRGIRESATEGLNSMLGDEVL